MVSEECEGVHDNCAYCSSSHYSVVVTFPEGTAVRCHGCRLVRTLPYPRFDYDDNRAYALGYDGRELLFERFAREFMDFIELHAPGRRLLEVGSGMGFLLDEAGRRGFTARGLEINRWEVGMTVARGLDVQAGTLDAANVPDSSIDVVCMSHVLEHVLDLRLLLRHARRVLRPGGTLAFAQPHYAAPLVGVLGHLWYGWQWEQHLWHFDVPALIGALHDHGFTRAGVAYNSLHHPWTPQPFVWKPKIVAVQMGTAALARAEVLLNRGDQFYLAARRPMS